MPVSRQIVLQEYRWARSAAILGASTAILGLPEPLAFGPRIPDAGTDPFGNQASFEFGHGTENRKDHLARGCAGVYLRREGNEVYPEGFEGFERTEQVRN